jgi:pimeloyl-ACP methyl ester carboxylesterase
MAQQACMLDSLSLEIAAVPSPPGLPMLIIDSDNDPILRASARAALRSEYPGANTHEFRGAGHVSAVVATDEYADVVRRFLDA